LSGAISQKQEQIKGGNDMFVISFLRLTVSLPLSSFSAWRQIKGFNFQICHRSFTNKKADKKYLLLKGCLQSLTTSSLYIFHFTGKRSSVYCQEKSRGERQCS